MTLPALVSWPARWRRQLQQMSIRYQLWALFGLFLVAGVTVLVIDEVAQYRARQALLVLKNDSLQRLRGLKAISDGYGLTVVDTTFRVRNGLISWQQGARTIDTVQQRLAQEWASLQRMPRAPAQQRLYEKVQQVRVDADAATAELSRLLRRRDMDALGRFADARMYPAIDPVTARIQKLSELAMTEAGSLVDENIARNRATSVLRIAISLLGLLLVALFGRAVLRNAYRGVESLTFVARRMRAHDYTAQPRYQPRGELATVMDAFTEMRTDVIDFERELIDQLARNEATHAELVRGARFQKSLLDAAQVAIFGIDKHGVWTVFNPFAEHLLGRGAGEMLGKVAGGGRPHQPGDAPLLMDPEQVETSCAWLSQQLGREVPRDWHALIELALLKRPPTENTLVHRDGHAVPVLLALSAFKDGDGELAGAIAVAADLTVLKQLQADLRTSEAEAQAANHAKSAFLAAMSHEIRTPLIGVTGMIEVLAHTPLDADQRHALNIIQHSSESLMLIVGDILDFSKIEAGRLDLAPEPVQLAALLRSVVANHSGAASSKGLAMECRVDERVASAHLADPLRWRQIVGNFLSNAIKFTETGAILVTLSWVGEVELAGAASRGSERLCLRVKDSGIGVSEQAQTRLFQPFSQAEGDTTRRFGGTGLGLAICRRLAQLMDGEVRMQSAPGRGTTMILDVVLPRADADAVAAEPTGDAAPTSFTTRALPSVEQARRAGRLVLLADDHPINRLVIARQLALAGYASEAVEDGVQALQRWRSGHYGLLLSDVHMPGRDGYQLARAIREEESRAARPRTPIIALTASALKGEAERCLGAGMDDYLTKPVSVAVLQRCLQHWLPDNGTGLQGGCDDAEHVEAVLMGTCVEAEPAEPLAVLDRAMLNGLTAGDAAEVRALLADFFDCNRKDLAELDAALDGGDVNAVARQAHRIKGAARLVGAMDLAQCVQGLEAVVPTATLTELRELSVAVHTAAKRLVLHVAELDA